MPVGQEDLISAFTGAKEDGTSVESTGAEAEAKAPGTKDSG